MSKKLRLILSLISITIIFICVNILSNKYFYKNRIDLTAEKIFTISPETSILLKELQEPIKIRLFFTSKLANGLPVFTAYHARISNLLKQYSELSQGKISVELIEPEPFSTSEDLAESHGLEGVNIDNAGKKFYFGLSAENSTDERGTIAFFDPDRTQFLEYDLTKLITKLANSETKKIGLISNLPVRGGGDFKIDNSFAPPTPQWAFLNQLEEQYEVRDVPKNAEFIPDDIEILLIIHPHNFKESTLYAIEQFVLRGGKAIIFMDSSVNLSTQEIITSDLSQLLDNWGIRFSSDQVATSKAKAINVQSLSADSRLTSYPKISWLEVDSSNMAADSIVTENLKKIRFIEGGFFETIESSQLKMRPLIRLDSASSTIKADIQSRHNSELSMQDYNNFVPDGKEKILAAQFNGKIKASLSPDDLDYKDDDVKTIIKQRHLSESKQDVNLILVADTDMLRNEFWARVQDLFGQTIIVPEADNGAFVLNAVELLSGDNLLINLRTRGVQTRRFEVLDNLRKTAEERFQMQERELKEKLSNLERRLKDLQSTENTNELFSKQQRSEISNFRDLFMQTRNELRAVQLELTREINQLGNILAFANIFIIPIILIILSLFIPNFLRKRSAKRLCK
jgi:ABC-type uncharacterized transport system involved in gliding motility auxiliary subunit